MSESPLFPSVIGKTIIRLDSVNSTNQYLSDLTNSESLEEGTAVLAREQTSGRGQKGTVWKSEPGKNLIVSFLLQPHFLPVSDQFLLSKAVALSVLKTLRKHLQEMDEIRIKWPNDIYVNDRKISGILIENSLHNSKIRQSIIGIGINVNQIEFPSEFHATSLLKILGKETDIQLIFGELCLDLHHYYTQLKSTQRNRIHDSYRNELYKLNEWSKFEWDSTIIEAMITGVDISGKLQLTKRDGQLISADLKEITFVRVP